MKNKISLIALCLMPFMAEAQQIAKTVLAEHFTNTYCSVCASRNPGLFGNLRAFPQVVHLAYYPSAPYAACPLSRHNPTEADARTNYYGIYGGTPQLVVGGSVVSGTFTNPAIFSGHLSATTSFAMTTSISKVGADSVAVSIVFKKVDTSSLTSLQLFGAVVEDTLTFMANNGEPAHHNVFRKALWGTASLSITAPVSVGDSSVYTKTVAVSSAWNLSRIYSVAILQRSSKAVEQAAKSARLGGPSTSVSAVKKSTLVIYPNPATDKLYFDNYSGSATVLISNSNGGVVMNVNKYTGNSIDLSLLEPGVYYLSISGIGQEGTAMFVKK